MSRAKRAARLKAIGEHVLTAPILVGGDAEELVAILREGAESSGISVVTPRTATDPAHVVVLAIDNERRRSSILKAATAMRGLEGMMTTDAVRIAIIRSGRSKLTPGRVQRLLGDEILFHVGAALTTDSPLMNDRSFRQRLGLAALGAAGLSIVRLG